MAHESDLRKNKEKYVHIQTCAEGVENHRVVPRYAPGVRSVPLLLIRLPRALRSVLPSWTPTYNIALLNARCIAQQICVTAEVTNCVAELCCGSCYGCPQLATQGLQMGTPNMTFVGPKDCQ